MKSFVGLIFAVALVEFASAVNKEYVDKALATKEKCAKEHNIDPSVIKEFVKQKKLPETEEGKCMIACYMEEMKMIADGKINIEEWKSSNKLKWENAADIDTANKILENCSVTVSPDGKNKCEFAFELTKCMLEAATKEGLSNPLENRERR